MPAEPSAAERTADAAPHRVLIVANETVGADDLLAEIRRFAAEQNAEFFVCVPASPVDTSSDLTTVGHALVTGGDKRRSPGVTHRGGDRVSRTVMPAGPSGASRGPRNGLGTVTFVIVVLAALLAVFPATAAFGFLLCLLALVPAFVAHRRTRKGTATNRRRAIAAVLIAPVFLVVAMVVGAAPAPSRVEPASDATRLADAAPVAPVPAAVAPLVAPPAPTTVVVPAVDAPSNPTKAASRTGVTKAAPTKASSIKAPRAAAPTSARTDAVVRAAAPAPAAKPAVKPSKPTPTAAAGSSVACDDDTHYVNAKGNCVLRPVKAASAPDGATAKCNDGTYSSSQTRSGTCSRHGGVAEWL